MPTVANVSSSPGLERGRHLPSLPGIDIDGHAVEDYRNEGGELLVTVHWHHRCPVEWSRRGEFFTETTALSHGPCVSTTLHVLPDFVSVVSAPVPSSVEAELIGFVAGLFAADDEAAADRRAA